MRGRLGAGTARGGAGLLADATPAPEPRAGTGPALRAGVLAGAGTEETGGGPLADSLPRSDCGLAGSRPRRGRAKRVAGGRRTAFPQGNFKLEGASSLAGTRQVLVASSWAQQHGGGSPLSGRSAWRPESGWALTAGRKEAKEGRR